MQWDPYLNNLVWSVHGNSRQRYLPDSGRRSPTLPRVRLSGDRNSVISAKRLSTTAAVRLTGDITRSNHHRREAIEPVRATPLTFPLHFPVAMHPLARFFGLRFRFLRLVPNTTPSTPAALHVPVKYRPAASLRKTLSPGEACPFSSSDSPTSTNHYRRPYVPSLAQCRPSLHH
ncbi:hypothetical protein J6590_089879 [Homalodisca vitripennis]|nr:hypothetical protein J6590_089879 [Homalodisca vitripennis]